MSSCVVSFFFTRKLQSIVEDICGQGIKPGGQADVDFLNKIILPYYISKKWLTKDPPAGQNCLGRTFSPFSFYSSRLGKRERQDYQKMPQEFVQLL